jgi:hypothetical protein
VAGALQNLECAALGTRLETLEGCTLVDECLGDVQVLLVQVLVVFVCLDASVRDGRGDQLVDGL